AGVGSDDGRKYALGECERLVDFLENDKEYGGFTVLLGVPSGWRSQMAPEVCRAPCCCSPFPDGRLAAGFLLIRASVYNGTSDSLVARGRPWSDYRRLDTVRASRELTLPGSAELGSCSPMRVVLAEKPSVARELAAFLRASTRAEGYFEGQGYQVTWALGHLATLKEPEDYDPALERWSLETLPIVPERFGLKLVEEKGARKQFAV